MADARTDGEVLNSTNISFMSSLWAIKLETLEAEVQILWNGILSTWFPPSQSYIIKIKTTFFSDEVGIGAVVFEVFSLRLSSGSTDIGERQILTVACKRSGEDTQKGWEKAEHQLPCHIEVNENPAGCSGMYGACAIGKKVVFYDWTQASGRLTPIGQLLNLDYRHHRPFVEDMLNLVKENGWERTN